MNVVQRFVKDYPDRGQSILGELAESEEPMGRADFLLVMSVIHCEQWQHKPYHQKWNELEGRVLELHREAMAADRKSET